MVVREPPEGVLVGKWPLGVGVDGVVGVVVGARECSVHLSPIAPAEV